MSSFPFAAAALACVLSFPAQTAVGQSAAAQLPPNLQLAALPDRLDARVESAAPGSLVALTLGLVPGTTLLPGGAALDLVPLAVPAMAFADGFGNALLTVRFPLGQGAGQEFLAQAIVLDASAAGALLVTPLREARLPQIGAEADVIVLFGQSNAEGFAPLAAVPAALRGAHPRVRIWNDAQSEFQPLEAGVNNMLFPMQQHVGPEIGMVEIAKDLPQPIWLVKVAVSQSALGPVPGPWNEWGANAGELYPELMRRIAAATQRIAAQGLVPRVRLLCMMQGETDALDPVLAAAYRTNLQNLIAQMRADIALLGSAGGQVPWFRVGLVGLQLGPVGFRQVRAVRAAQVEVASTTDRCDIVETSGLLMAPDRVHFAFAGLQELGRTFLGRRSW